MKSIEKRIQKRAIQSMRCLNLNKRFFLDSQLNGLSAAKVFFNPSKYCEQGARWFINTNDVEKAFILLIKVGVLRREVDGQGLTSSVRLTPLGRKILEDRPDSFYRAANFGEMINFWVYRNLRLR